MQQIVLNGDSLEVLKKYSDNYFDAVVTDPPYGLGKEPEAVEVMTAWASSGYHEVSGKGFMGKEWDAFVPQPVFWKEVFRVLKPGGHVVAFFGTRTYDWGVMAMRFAGFEVRDCIQWIYGSGFPKSHNIGKAIDKRGGNNHLTQEIGDKLKEARESRKITKTQADEMFCNGTTNYMWFEGRSDGIRLPDDESFEKICNEWEELKPYQDLIKSANREVIGNYDGDMGGLGGERLGQSGGEITIPATDLAKQWDGWGSALKPANEPIVLARKPLEKGLSIAENVLKWGVGAINIDGCRVGNVGATKRSHQSEYPKKENGTEDRSGHWARVGHNIEELNKGRFPANIILTHHPECECKGLKKVKAISGGTGMGALGKNGKYGKFALDRLADNAGGVGDENGEETVEDWTCHPDCPIKIMDEQSGILKSGAMDSVTKGGKFNVYGQMSERRVVNPPSEGGASRFFYCAKASKSERNKGLEGFEDKFSASAEFRPNHMEKAIEGESVNPYGRWTPIKNFHPTVKPVKLMQYLARLITPPNGIVLDPFCGSGTTGIACKLEGFQFVGIEQDSDYSKIAQARIDNWLGEAEENTIQQQEIVQAKLF